MRRDSPSAIPASRQYTPIALSGVRFRTTGDRQIIELHSLFPQTIELVETHRLATPPEGRFTLDLEMPSDVPVEWPPTLPQLGLGDQQCIQGLLDRYPHFLIQMRLNAPFIDQSGIEDGRRNGRLRGVILRIARN